MSEIQGLMVRVPPEMIQHWGWFLALGIGLLLLGCTLDRQWTPEELEFLRASGKQLAMAVENFRLLEQVLLSRLSWSAGGQGSSCTWWQPFFS